MIVPLLALALQAAKPGEGESLAVPRPGVLVFSRTTGFRHDSIPAGVKALTEIGKARGWTVAATESPAVFTDAGLKPYDAVVFLCTTGDVLDDAQQAAFERFVRSGKGYVGVHSAADTEYDWPWYGRLVGGYFKRHPAVQKAELRVVDRAHPTTADLPTVWSRTDEWYDYRDLAPELRVLMKLDEKSYQGGEMGDHPIAWCHEVEGGRAWYTGLGHTAESYAEPPFRDALAEGILWAANGRPAPGAKAPTWANPEFWSVADGILKNDRGGRDLFSKEAYGDQQLHLEFRIAKGGNSGVFLQGRYELQVLDSHGKPDAELDVRDCGAVYERWKDGKGFEGSPPRRNAARPAGEWNRFDILFRAPRFANGKKTENARLVEVRLNGVVVQSNVELTGPTRNPMAEDERPLGPLLIQGHNGPTEIRNVQVVRRTL